MAKVNAHFRGGSYDDQRFEVAVDDPDNPPEVYKFSVTGPHEEILEHARYRRVGREQDEQTGADVWVYEHG
jgi:hypothetical protein